MAKKKPPTLRNRRRGRFVTGGGRFSDGTKNGGGGKTGGAGGRIRSCKESPLRNASARERAARAQTTRLREALNAWLTFSGCKTQKAKFLFGTVPGLEPAYLEPPKQPRVPDESQGRGACRTPGRPPALRGAGGRCLFSFFTTHPVETQGRGMLRILPACHPALCWSSSSSFLARLCLQGWVMRWNAAIFCRVACHRPETLLLRGAGQPTAGPPAEDRRTMKGVKPWAKRQ